MYRHDKSIHAALKRYDPCRTRTYDLPVQYMYYERTFQFSMVAEMKVGHFLKIYNETLQLSVFLVITKETGYFQCSRVCSATRRLSVFYEFGLL